MSDSGTASHVRRSDDGAHMCPAKCTKHLHTDTRPRALGVLRAGPVPTELAQLTALQDLSLHGNQLLGACENIEQGHSLHDGSALLE